jgi:hypothetical protein
MTSDVLLYVVLSVCLNSILFLRFGVFKFVHFVYVSVIQRHFAVQLYAHNNSLRLSILSTSSQFYKCLRAACPSQSANIL